MQAPPYSCDSSVPTTGSLLPCCTSARHRARGGQEALQAPLRSYAPAQARTKVPSMAIGGIRLCNFTTFACMSLFIVYIFPDTLFSPKYT